MGSRWKTVLTVVAAVLFVRALLLGVYMQGAAITAAAVAAGHDGLEYLDYASALARRAPEEVPLDARRHNPGWPLLLALPSALMPPWMAATALVWLLSAGCVWLFAEILRVKPDGSGDASTARPGATVGWSRDDTVLVWVFALGYPTLVYYQSFALVDAALVFSLLGALVAHLRGHYALAQVVSGFVGLVRAPALVIAPLLALDSILRVRRPQAAVHLIWAVLPTVAWFFVSRHWWGLTYMDFHAPVFGWPFGGAVGMSEVSVVRAGYVWSATAFFLLSGFVLVRAAHGRRLRDPEVNTAAAFTVGFVGMHLCLQSLEYYGRTIPTFNYWDRYFVAAWPFALLAWRGRLRPWMAAVCVAASVALSVWWGLNYFDALKRQGRPVRVERTLGVGG
ncbi:MAG: hypothetical protein N2111_05790 [Candidatus Sumerlaeaceae bacterium]|nr:hypothetical protein [Candidatus Sumerlaeaceae bacterium]